MKSMNKIKSLVVAAFASLFSVAFTLVTVTTLAACGNDNTAGTDEQPNAITAQIDAAIDHQIVLFLVIHKRPDREVSCIPVSVQYIAFSV